MRGTAVAVLDDITHDPVARGAQSDVSRTGTLVYRRHAGSSATVQWLDTTGKQEPLLAKPGAYVGTPRVSPDGKRIAITIRGWRRSGHLDLRAQAGISDGLTPAEEHSAIRCGLTTDGMLSTVCWAAASDGVVRTVLARRRCCRRVNPSRFRLPSRGTAGSRFPGGRQQSAKLVCSD